MDRSICAAPAGHIVDRFGFVPAKIRSANPGLSPMRTSTHASTLDGMQAAHSSSVDLYWIPLGAGGHSVRFNGRAFEAIEAARQHRPRCDLYHAALIVTLDGEQYTIELAPAWDANAASRGVVCTGAVGSRYLGWSRLFRYELRCWRGGSIPDLHYAVGGAQHLTSDPSAARRLLDVVAAVPTPVWGRDELNTGEMWNCNSVIAWLITTADIPTEDIQPPVGGRAPGWDPGLLVASRNNPTTRPGGERAPLVAPLSARCPRSSKPALAQAHWHVRRPREEQ